MRKQLSKIRKLITEAAKAGDKTIKVGLATKAPHAEILKLLKPPLEREGY